MISVTAKVTGDVQQFGRAAENLKQSKKLLKQVGVLLMSSAVDRLSSVLSQDADAVRTGKLGASLRVNKEGSGSSDTIFELSDALATVGSNLPYAAQVHHGGTIRPVSGKLLAIPIPAKLKRSRRWPRDIDPQRKLLTFIPNDSGFGGVLVDEEGVAGFGKGVLFVLVPIVRQDPRPFLFVGDEDQQVIEDELWPRFVESKN